MKTSVRKVVVQQKGVYVIQEIDSGRYEYMRSDNCLNRTQGWHSVLIAKMNDSLFGEVLWCN